MNSSADRWSLSELQDWLRSVTTDPSGIREGLLRARQRHGEGFPVRVPNGVLPGDRLAIYARGYLDRLLSCLRADFPALRALLGEEMFDGFALAYLRAQPPRHYSMFELGAGFVTHLESTCPSSASVAAEHRALLRLPVDLARTERARLEVSRAKGNESSNCPYSPDFDRLMSEPWSISTTACLRIVSLDHDVRPFLDAVDHGCSPVRPESRSTVLAVSRVDYRVMFTALVAWQQRVLASCSRPRPLLELAHEAAQDSGEERGAQLAELLLWLPAATALGMVSASVSG